MLPENLVRKKWHAQLERASIIKCQTVGGAGIEFKLLPCKAKIFVITNDKKGQLIEAERILVSQYEQEILLVEPTNNVCERRIRPLVIIRKNSYSNKVLSAAQNLFVLKSVIETARSNGVRPFEIIFALFHKETLPDLDKIILSRCEVYRQLMFSFPSSQNAIGPPS